MSLGRVDDNGLAESEQSISFPTLRAATGRASTKPVVRSRYETLAGGAPCPPHTRYEETETDADSERILASRWGFDSEPWEEPS